jgi:D-threitol dehydrogenase (NAD+)
MSQTAVDLDFRLDDKVALVTGGASGIGAAIGAAFATKGATVAIADLSDGCEFHCNVADPDSVQRTVDAAIDAYGRIDILVNSAGIVRLGPAEELSLKDWDATIDVNLKGTFLMCQAVGNRMLAAGRGVIINMASQAATVALDAHVAYCASKFGVVGFTRALTAELQGIVGVTMLVPGGMHTAFFDDRDEKYKPPADAKLNDPANVAQAVLFALRQPEGCEVRELVITPSVESSWP